MRAPAILALAMALGAVPFAPFAPFSSRRREAPRPPTAEDLARIERARAKRERKAARKAGGA